MATLASVTLRKYYRAGTAFLPQEEIFTHNLHWRKKNHKREKLATSRNLDIFSRRECWEDRGSVQQVTACDKVHPRVVLTFGRLSYAVSGAILVRRFLGEGQDNRVLQNAPAVCSLGKGSPDTLKPKNIVYRPRICALGFKAFFLFICVCMRVCARTCTWVFLEAHRGRGISWNWNCRGLWAARCVLGTAVSLSRGQQCLNSWALSPAL